ncbi:DnaB-like helicase C-terminal domain-containing protein [Pantoea agglomerans]|uniref:DnaB-like helicase C-terminal domain-containing protein n=1 Tax=Enterobacter agglomerans TaxID=549 RepID=UPI003C7A902B
MTTNPEFKMAPHNLDAEQAVIGGLMLDGGQDRSQRVFAMLKPESFFSGPHRVIYKTIRDMAARQQPIDLLTVSDVLEAQSFESVNFAYLAEITKGTPSAANIVQYAAVVRDRAMERYAIEKMNQAIELLYTRSTMTAADKLAATSSLFSQISDYANTGNQGGLRSFGDIAEDWAAELERRFDPNGNAHGMTTGIPSLDRLLAPKGLVSGSLFVIGARPKMGKTTLYGQMALNCAVNEQKPALLFSLEMPGIQILEKLVSQKSGVNPKAFYPAPNDPEYVYAGDLDGDLNKAYSTTARLSELGLLFVDDTPGMTLAHIAAEARRIKREKGCVGMVLVDYLTLMGTDKADRNDLAFAAITKGLKNLAKELDCIVVLLSQLNRASDNRTDKRPLPSDSRDTGQIEQDCDYWLGIYREGYYDESLPAGITELILRLNRHGQGGTVFCMQKNGAIHDMDQDAARADAAERQAGSRSAKKGGF